MNCGIYCVLSLNKDAFSFWSETKRVKKKRCHLFHFGGSCNVLCRKLAADRTFELADREKAKLWIKLDTILGPDLRLSVINA